MKSVRLICRNSRLSLLQAEIVKKKILAAVPGIQVQILGRSSRGDREAHVPLTSLEGTDFFTEEIFESLQKWEPEIAVHSLKDLSAQHFFSHDAFAIVDRDDPRDVAIFNPGIEEKMINGTPLIIGTCSPRREEMATVFLKRALPQLSSSISIETRSIRGSVENRLQQLENGDFDATILATAGLNRLLDSEHIALVKGLLHGKRLMFLPMIECVPAPCQGAIVVEAHPENKEMVTLLEHINDAELFEVAYNEKLEARKYGTGSFQQFGVTTFTTPQGKTLYAAGTDAKGRSFSKWSGLPELEIDDKTIVSTTDYMGSFFDYAYMSSSPVFAEPAVYVAHHKAVVPVDMLNAIRTKRVWASGSKTWFELAKEGIWVEGCADAFGLTSLIPVFKQPLINLKIEDIQVITHQKGADHWINKGWKAIPTYSTSKKNNISLEDKLYKADIVFWTSIHQYLQYKDILKDNVIHLAPSGETSILLKQQGIDPIIFPTIKAFEQWRKSSILLPCVA